MLKLEGVLLFFGRDALVTCHLSDRTWSPVMKVLWKRHKFPFCRCCLRQEETNCLPWDTPLSLWGNARNLGRMLYSHFKTAPQAELVLMYSSLPSQMCHCFTTYLLSNKGEVLRHDSAIKSPSLERSTLDPQLHSNHAKFQRHVDIFFWTRVFSSSSNFSFRWCKWRTIQTIARCVRMQKHLLARAHVWENGLATWRLFHSNTWTPHCAKLFSMSACHGYRTFDRLTCSI